ncbi:MAG: SulP family inorganic anion transporter [Terriglobales bacterium]
MSWRPVQAQAPILAFGSVSATNGYFAATTSRAYALRYHDQFSENVDLVGLALANAAAGCSSTFVVNGSPTKTEMVDGAGGRSQLSHLVTATMVLMVLLFLTKPLSHTCPTLSLPLSFF